MRVLLTGPVTAGDPSFQSILTDAASDTQVVSDPLSPAVLDRIAEGRFDGVVCQAEGPEAIRLLSQIRGSNASVPIVVLSGKADRGLETQAFSMGASFMVSTEAGAAAIAENIRSMLALKGAGRTFLDRTRTNRQLRDELREAVLHRKSISQGGAHARRDWLRRGLLPLLIENDPDEAVTMAQAFEKADLYAPLPIMRSAEEALAYLQGSTPFENRNLFPLPNAILLDLTPLSLGLGLLRWFRQQKQFCSIPVIVLSRSATPEEVNETYGSLASSFLVKSDDFDELVVLIRFIEVYWTQMNFGADF